MRTGILRRDNFALLLLVGSFAVLVAALVASQRASVEAMQQGPTATSMFAGFDSFVFGFGQFFLVGLPSATVVTLVDLFRKRSDSAGQIQCRVSLTLCAVAWLFLFWNLPVLLSQPPLPPPNDDSWTTGHGHA